MKRMRGREMQNLGFVNWKSKLQDCLRNCNFVSDNYRTNYFILVIFVNLGLALITRPLAILGAAFTALSKAFLNDRTCI
ncbi:hypothetical protein HA466_0244030 [Hirschfeldia incana]|nr:hypothetical protein HA466_0244030 [Hirschfeldia incana]